MGLFDKLRNKCDKKITKEEFIKRVREDEDYAPGWEAIEGALKVIYKDQEPAHFGTLITSRAIFGGDEYLDGYSIYDSSNGYKHIVTFGMTELYGNEEAFGGEWNKWGYEMTIKLKADNDDCMWAMDMLGNLARYTYSSERFFEPYQYIQGNGSSICKDKDSKITALFIVNDTELTTIDTVYGKTDFLQMVGITENDLQKLKEDSDNALRLYELIKQDNPYFVTDLNSKKSYL